MKKVIIGVIVVVLVIIAGVVIALNVGKDKDKETEETSAKPENHTIANTTNTNVENNIAENNAVENNTAEENNTENNEIEESGLIDEKRAIEIVKKEWGNTNGYEFVIDYQNSDGEYVIAVRDSNTTRVIEWYVVNAETGKCSIM